MEKNLELVNLVNEFVIEVLQEKVMHLERWEGLDVDDLLEMFDYEDILNAIGEDDIRYFVRENYYVEDWISTDWQ